jgi:DNA-binding Lrp family transcriptional regulator
MIGAYIMISATPGSINRILAGLKKLDHIENVAVITGEYDIVVKVDVYNMQELAELADAINMIDGVSKTHTHVIMRETKV